MRKKKLHIEREEEYLNKFGPSYMRKSETMEGNDNQVVQRLKAYLGRELTDGLSPFGNWLRGTFRKVEEGSLTIEFTIREDMSNPIKILHGGVTAAIMDDTMGMTVASLGRDTFYTTVNLSIDYLSSAKIGDTITASTKINREGKNIVNVDCLIVNAEGKILAKGTSNLIKTTIPK
jgi:acyl-coenzyme A thioesterase 13